MDEFASRTYPIREDMQFQQRSWLFERIGWIMLALVVAAALAGVFFHGPASHVRDRNADNSVAVEYERFAHRTARTHFVLRATAPIPDEILVRLSPAFTNTFDIESVEPR